MSAKNVRDLNAIRLCRRDLLKLGVAGAAASSVMALPFLRRSAVAALRPDAPAKRVLVLYFGGGVRSSCMFHASGTMKYNPWGLIDGTNTPFALGKLLDDFLPAGTPISAPQTPLPDAAYQLSPMGAWAGAQVPRLREIAGNFSVVGTWNSERGDHYRSAVEESTGSMTGTDPGLLTRIGAGMAANVTMDASDGGTTDTGDGGATDGDAGATDADGGVVDPGSPAPIGSVPTFHIEPGSAFGNATDATLRNIPVPMFGSASLPGRADLNDMEEGLLAHDFVADESRRTEYDDRALRRRVGFSRNVVEVFRGDRLARRDIGARLSQPWFDVSQNADASQGAAMVNNTLVPLTNAMIYETFVRALGPDPNGDGVAPYMNPEMSPFYNNAMDVALAIRLLQLGSPGIAVEMGGFDTHSGERTDAPDRFRFVGRLWSTLQFLLSRIPEPGEPGKTMLDRTLIFTMSEFGRDPGQTGTGFNNGEGSDHGSDASCFYLASAVMGGGIQAGKLIGPAPTTNYIPQPTDRVPPKRLLCTALWALGLDNTDPDWGFADAAPLTELWTP